MAKSCSVVLLFLLSLPLARSSSLVPVGFESNCLCDRRCSYSVAIATSCSSPKRTRDMIALEFGDRYGTQVSVSRLDDLSSGTFKQCSTDNFNLTGPCASRTCFLYLFRYGRDGWCPRSVNVSGPFGVDVFYYGQPLPNKEWYGADICDIINSNIRPSTVVVTAAALIAAVVTFFCSFSS